MKYGDFLQSYPKLKHTLLTGIAGKHSAADDKLVLSMGRRDIHKMRKQLSSHVGILLR